MAKPAPFLIAGWRGTGTVAVEMAVATADVERPDALRPR